MMIWVDQEKEGEALEQHEPLYQGMQGMEVEALNSSKIKEAWITVFNKKKPSPRA